MNENQSGTFTNIAGILAGFLIGSLAGALAMLFLAPQSGKETRKQMRQKGIELRDDATEMMDDAVTQMHTSANKIVSGGRQKITDIKELASERLDRVADLAHAGKNTISGK
jgi:gas vesicle protein